MKNFIEKLKKNLFKWLNKEIILYWILILIWAYFIFLLYNINNSRIEVRSIKLDISLKNEEIEKIEEEIKIIKKEMTEKIKEYDLISDTSIHKFVNHNISFNEFWYIPSNLVKIWSNYIYDAKWWTQLLKKEANDNLQLMAKKFLEDTWEKMVVVSAYRSYQYQKWIKLWWCSDNLCAKAWYSEHQSWLAVDLWDASTNYKWMNNKKLKGYYEWLKNNAKNYGFHNTYRKWLEIDWYEIEPWHWRYLWIELAKYLDEKDLTFAEYYKQNLLWKN